MKQKSEEQKEWLEHTQKKKKKHEVKIGNEEPFEM